MVSGIYAGPWFLIMSVKWFNWASKRNRLTGAVYFINEMRKRLHLLTYIEDKDRDFYVHLAKYGIIHRVGSSRGIYKNTKGVGTPVWESIDG